MRKKIFLALFILPLTGIFIVNCNNEQSAKINNADQDSVQNSIARGDYLVNNVAACFDCHGKRDFRFFAGPIVEGSEGMGGAVLDHKLTAAIPGTLYGKNITPDSATGIGTWTDEEIMRALTQGINKNGDTLFPLMPYPLYNNLPRQDILDIIAYIKTLRPINNAVPERSLMIPISMAYPPNLHNNFDQNKRPDEKDKVKYGEYILSIADCINCHTPRNEKGEMGDVFSGGLKFTTPAFTVFSANITPDSLTGIGAWTEQMFLDKFKTYREKDGYQFDPGKKNSIMPWTIFSKMNDDDLKAIYAYLRTLKPVKNKVEKWPVEIAAR